jgi:hypothetical protein
VIAQLVVSWQYTAWAPVTAGTVQAGLHCVELQCEANEQAHDVQTNLAESGALSSKEADARKKSDAYPGAMPPTASAKLSKHWPQMVFCGMKSESAKRTKFLKVWCEREMSDSPCCRRSCCG